jgi:hypothetical protein
MAELPTISEALDYIDDPKNRDRWGPPDDQRGTLNLIKTKHRVATARLVTEERIVSCARDLEALSAVCKELGRWEFQFISPPRAMGGSRSPVNPLAAF